jgi:hypothetical protein
LAALAVAFTALIVATDVQPASAGGTHVETQGCSDSANNDHYASCSLTSYAGAGDLWVVYAAWNDASTASADDDDGSGGLTSVASAASWGPSNGYRQKVWYMENTPNTVFSATVTFSGTPSWWHVVIQDYSGLATSGALNSSTPFAGQPSNFDPQHLVTYGEAKAAANTAAVFFVYTGTFSSQSISGAVLREDDSGTAYEGVGWSDTTTDTNATVRAYAHCSGSCGYYASYGVEFNV